MKKISTYYFAAMVAVNGFLVWFIPYFSKYLTSSWRDQLGGQALPGMSELFAIYAQWPWIFLVFSIVGIALSLVTKIRSETLCHVVIVGIATEAVVLFFAMVAYAIPLIPTKIYALE